METDVGNRPFGDLKQQTIHEDDARAAEWLAERERLEKILEEFGNMNVSANGTFSPSYLKVVK
jgi:hypothetical protein